MRNTRNVDILVRRADFDPVKAAMEADGFIFGNAYGVDFFLDGVDAKPSEGVHLLYAGEKVKETDPVPTPLLSESERGAAFQVVSLEPLVRMKLVSFRRKDQVHLQDMIQLGLIDATWPALSVRARRSPPGNIGYAGWLSRTEPYTRDSPMQLHRRTFLRAAGVTLALPLLESNAIGAPGGKTPRRMVCINTPLGLHPAAFFPDKSGKDYELSPYLEVVKEFRDDFTVISGLSHPDVGASHDSNYSFLTGAPHPEQRAGFKNSISLDQFAADFLHGQTRYASLPLACEGFGLAWTRSGAGPAEGLAVERICQAVHRRPTRRGRGAEAPPRRTARASSTRCASRRKTCGPRSAPATATNSTSTSPASANWSSDWRSPKRGRRNRNRRWM